ncbi:MAG TPA: 3'-5' exonuclease [Candidatus Nanoarchaeia archaeon]|nr:3'-5' exonuclease [Candidatus Nanoarchaeia archaeon]
MIVIDLEMSGLDFKKNSILSIGALDFNNSKNTFYGECTLRKGTKIDDKAIAVCGFTRKQIKENKKSCEKLLKEFLEWTDKISDKTLAGHNVHFDIAFLQENFKIYKLKWDFGHRIVDLHSVFYFNFMKGKVKIPIKYYHSALNLDFIIDYFKLKKREGTHNALEDAQLTAQAFSKLLGR